MFNQARVWGPRTIANMNRTLFGRDIFHYILSEYFKIHNLDAEMVIASPTTQPPLRDVIDSRDYMLMTAIRGDHDILFGAQHNYAPAFSMLREIEGVPDAVAVNTKTASSVLGSNYETREIAIPFSDATQNVREEQLALVPDPDCSGLRVARSTRLSGHCKDGVQDRLLTIEEFYDYERRFYNNERTLEQRVLERKDPGTIASELRAALEKVRADQKESFETEARTWIYPDITELQLSSIRNPGTRHTDPEFSYTSRFRANSVLRPAGNNVILQLGDFIRNLPELRPEQKQRQETAYIGFASTYRATYSIRVPEGFSVSGVEALNKNVGNDLGRFEVSATLDDKVVTVKLLLSCTEAVYRPPEWARLATVLEAAGAWKNSRILFRKNS